MTTYEALKIVSEVAGTLSSDWLPQYRAGFQLACEEISYRLVAASNPKKENA